jgi:dinuclear metal center YbgI/SA1388 family protein
MAADLREIVTFLDRELNTAGIPDYSGALNGLQLENGGRVERIVAAVDASLPVIEKAAAGGPGLLVVHHGMFWQGARPVTGALFRKLKIAMEAGLAIYSSHLPLDIHPDWGNNIGLARAIGLLEPVPFLQKRGILSGLRGEWSGSRDDLRAALSRAVGGPVTVCAGRGDAAIASVGIITGGAGSEVEEVAATGVDAFISGEGPHWSAPLAEELGIDVFYGGHYATETFGVKSLAAALGKRFGLPHAFIDHPSGL